MANLLDRLRAHQRWVLVVIGVVVLALTWNAVRVRTHEAPVTLPLGPSGHARVVLVPGQEGTIEPALGRDAPLPGDCRYLDAEITPAQITARYACPDQPQPVVLNLYAGTTIGRELNGSTGRFSAWTPPGFPPALRDAVFARLRQREDRLFWQVEGASPASTRRGLGRGRAAIPFPSLGTLLHHEPTLGLAAALAFLLAYVWRLIRGEPRQIAWVLAATVLAGAALRLGLAVEAPMNAHSFSRVFPLAAELFRGPLATWFSQHSDGHFYFTSAHAWTNCALALAMPLVFFAHARLLFGDARTALVAALLMALLPMHIRFSRSDVTFISSLINSSFTFVALYGWLTDPSRAWRLACLALFPVMSLATYQSRPENIIFVGLDLGALALYLGKGAPRPRLLIAGAAIAVVATYSVVTDFMVRFGQNVSEGLSLTTLRTAIRIFFNPRFNTLVNPWMTAPYLPVLAVVGAVTLWRGGQKRRAAFLVAWLAIFFLVHSFVEPSTVAMQARYHLHLMSPFLLLAAAALPRVLALPRPLQGALLVWVLLTPALHVGFIRDVGYTEMQEYAFLRRVRGRIGPTCTVLEFSPAMELPRPVNYGALRSARMTLALHNGAQTAPRVRQLGLIPTDNTRLDAPEVFAPSADFVAHLPACLYYYESAACTTHRPAPGRLAAVCEEMHQRFSLSLVAEESHPLHPYDSVIVSRVLTGPNGTHWSAPVIRPPATVHLGLYRVTGRR